MIQHLKNKNLHIFLVFLLINFFGLFLGGLFTNDGITSTWYFDLNKALWTPPGWVFGASWTLIMLSLSILNYFMWKGKERVFLHLWIQSWIFNFLWNPMFFSLKSVELSLVIIMYLLILVSSMFYVTFKRYKHIHLLLLPYIIWLIIATSLNIYIVIFN
jgi:tryptophan-rich sensory protein